MAVKTRELFKELDRGKTYPVYLLLGEDSGNKESFLKLLERKLFQKSGEGALNKNVYFGSDALAHYVLEDLRTYSMFLDKKLVVVKEFEKLKDATVFLEYVTNPGEGSILVLMTEQNRTQKKIMDAVDRSGRACIFWQMFEDESERWIGDRLRALGVEAERKAVHYIVELSGTGRNELENQTAIISNYLSKGDRLTLDRAKQIVAQLQRSTVFDLCNSLFVAKASELLGIFHNLLENGEAPAKLLFFCNREIHRLFSAWCLNVSGNSFRNIEQKLGLRKKDAQRIRTLVQRMNLEHFLRLFSRLHQLDQTLKSSPKNIGILQFEQFVIGLGVQRKGG
jgi:DNA polymerase-3 subunit delta